MTELTILCVAWMTINLILMIIHKHDVATNAKFNITLQHWAMFYAACHWFEEVMR